MNDFLRMCLNIITQIGPYLVVLLLLKFFENIANHYRNSLFDFCSTDMYWTVC